MHPFLRRTSEDVVKHRSLLCVTNSCPRTVTQTPQLISRHAPPNFYPLFQLRLTVPYVAPLRRGYLALTNVPNLLSILIVIGELRAGGAAERIIGAEDWDQPMCRAPSSLREKLP